MAYTRSPNLCAPCQGIVDSPEFRNAIETMEYFDAECDHAAQKSESPIYDQYRLKEKYTEGPTFMLYGNLLASQHSCALCKLILECRTSVWGDPRFAPDYRPHLQDSASIDTKLIYGVDSSFASATSSVSLFIGTAEAKLAVVHISLPVGIPLTVHARLLLISRTMRRTSCKSKI